MPKFYLLPIAAGLLLLFPSCQKRHDPNNGTILRKSETNVQGSGMIATNYVYDETGRLIRLQIVPHPDDPPSGPQEAILMEFNDAGDLIKSSRSVPGTSVFDIEAFTYNNRSDTIRSLITPYRLQPSYTRQVVLDGHSRVISDSLYPIPTNGQVSFASYTWDATGNMTTATNGLIVNGVLQYSNETSYTYDTHRNPFKDFGLSYYLVTGEVKAFNANNVLTWTINNLRYTWQYKYNTNGLPLWSTSPAANGEWKSNFYYR